MKLTEVQADLALQGFKEKLFKDFIFFYWVSKCLEIAIPSIKRLKLSKNVEVLSEVSLNELDLTLEASAAEELSENFKDNPNYKVPKSISFRDELPKSNVGKILRRLLK